MRLNAKRNCSGIFVRIFVLLLALPFLVIGAFPAPYQGGGYGGPGENNSGAPPQN